MNDGSPGTESCRSGRSSGKSVFFATLAELIAGLAKTEREGQLSTRIRFLTCNAVLIIDEFGYLPLGSGGGNLFFQLVNACYEKFTLPVVVVCAGECVSDIAHCMEFAAVKASAYAGPRFMGDRVSPTLSTHR